MAPGDVVDGLLEGVSTPSRTELRTPRMNPWVTCVIQPGVLEASNLTTRDRLNLPH
jgi:hypothetical protein